MGLPLDAFDPIDGDDSRREAILNLASADYEACPGSGKTTLLVAKLAIMANRWPSRRQGICVLSHTNAARNEIGSRLSSCAAGVALLHYPHFVGTIHSFINEYLAIPWLRSKGWPVRAIDTGLTLRQRWKRVPYKTKTYLAKKLIDDAALTYDKPDFTGGPKGSLLPHHETYKILTRISEESSKGGFFCYDEMFVWATEHLDKHADSIAALRGRFPVVFIDEAQDNSELQSALLSRLFCEGGNPSCRQRFGDSNQAIYQHAEEGGATTDKFPGAVKHNIPRSFRFSQEIADRAKPLGVVPQRLVGVGPPKSIVPGASKPPTILLFEEGAVLDVLSRYGELLVSLFTAEELAKGVFTAVAGVHDKDDPSRVPCSMIHYASTYNAACARKETAPTTFAQHLARARFRMSNGPDVHPLVTATAEAVLQLTGLLGAQQQVTKRRSPHRLIRETLAEAPALTDYDQLVSLMLSKGGDLSIEDWNTTGSTLAFSAASMLAGSARNGADVTEFMAWPAHLETTDGEPAARTDNIFSYPAGDPKVHIRLGSIHSVKGETHTATLVLDSFYYDHHLVQLKPWLLGTKSGGSGGSNRLLGRLRLHYVAMTRPTHLLCLAMRRDKFTTSEIATLKVQGWTVIEVHATPPTSEIVKQIGVPFCESVQSDEF